MRRPVTREVRRRGAVVEQIQRLIVDREVDGYVGGVSEGGVREVGSAVGVVKIGT